MKAIKSKKMKNLFNPTLLILFSLAILRVSAQTNSSNQPKFSGQVKLPGGAPSGFDSISIQYYQPYTPYGIVSSKVNLTTDKNGNFSFKLPRYSHPNKLLINIAHQGKFRRISNGYFSEASDDIRIEIIKGEEDKAIFSGKGAEKYNLVHQLEHLMERFGEERTSLKLYEPDSLEAKIVAFNLLTRRFNKEKEALIANISLNEQIKKMVSREFANLYTEWDGAFWQYYSINYHNDPKLQEVLRKGFNQFKQEFTFPVDSAASLCPNYLIGVALRESRDIYLNNNTGSVDLKLFYQTLKNKYSGLTRERIISNLFIGMGGFIPEVKWDTQTFDSLMKASKPLITIPFVKGIFSNKLRLTSGEKLFEASFLNPNGDTIRTSSLKGKVVLLDMWNVGCSWCAVFHKDFHQNVYPLLKENKDFIYLSIGTDRTKERWLSGIESGLYTDPSYLNVNTGAAGINHPFAQYYNIQALPFMMLIDRNGNIYSRNIGKPEEALAFINKALNK